MTKIIKRNGKYRIVQYAATGQYQVISKRKGYYAPEGDTTYDLTEAVRLWNKLSGTQEAK